MRFTAGDHPLPDRIIQRSVPVGLKLHILRKSRQVQIFNMIEPFKIRAGHHHIDIVVPWNEALMADGSQKCAAAEGKIDIILFTQLCKRVHELQLQTADLIQCQFFHDLSLSPILSCTSLCFILS